MVKKERSTRRDIIYLLKSILSLSFRDVGDQIPGISGSTELFDFTAVVRAIVFYRERPAEMTLRAVRQLVALVQLACIALVAARPAPSVTAQPTTSRTPSVTALATSPTPMPASLGLLFQSSETYQTQFFTTIFNRRSHVFKRDSDHDFSTTTAQLAAAEPLIAHFSNIVPNALALAGLDGLVETAITFRNASGHQVERYTEADLASVTFADLARDNASIVVKAEFLRSDQRPSKLELALEEEFKTTVTVHAYYTPKGDNQALQVRRRRHRRHNVHPARL